MSTHKPRGYSINDFLSWHDRSELVLQPKFQRRDVWSVKAKSHLIDTVLRGLPIPIIFIRQDVNPVQRKTVREVVDGQQRLRAVIDYVKDVFPVLKSHNPEFGGLTFSKLSDDDQRSLLSYEFSVVVLEGAADRDVLEIFARLNTYGQKLTAQELLNAAYFGEFKRAVYDLGLEHLEFWRNNGILNDREIVRMAEAELTAELVVTMLSGIQHRRRRIEEHYERYDDAFPDQKRVEKEFRAIIDIIASCFDGALKRSMFAKRVLFSSLFHSLYHIVYGVPETPELSKGATTKHIPSSHLGAIRQALLDFQTRYRETPPPKNLQKFADAVQKATADREQRIIRVKTLADVIRSAL